MTETLSNIALLLYGLVSQNINRYNSQITASVVLILFLFVVFVVSFNRKSFFFFVRYKANVNWWLQSNLSDQRETEFVCDDENT